MILSLEQKIAYGNAPLPSKTFQVTRVKYEQSFTIKKWDLVTGPADAEMRAEHRRLIPAVGLRDEEMQRGEGLKR